VRKKYNKRKKYASKKQKYASSSHATDASGPCARKHNDRIYSIFHATQALVLHVLRVFEWKPGFSHVERLASGLYH